MGKRRKWPDYVGQFDVKQKNLLGGVNAPTRKFHPTRAGVVGVFHNALVYGSTRDIMSYYENKRGRKKAFGPFHGFMIGEVPADQPGVRGEHGRIRFEYTRDDPRIEQRKRGGAHMKKRGVTKGFYRKYLQANPVDKLLDGKKVKYPPTPEEVQAHLERRKVRDLAKRAQIPKTVQVQKPMTPDEAYAKMKREQGIK